MIAYDAQKRRTLIVVVLFFLVLTATIGAVGYKSYLSFETQSREDTERWLSVVANTKADAVTRWRNDLLDAAALLYKNQAFSRAAASYLKNAQDLTARTYLLDSLQAYQSRDEIDGIDLLNLQGTDTLSIPEETFAPESAILEDLPKARQTGEIVLVDFYRADDKESVHLAVLIPVVDENLVVGFVALRVDPQARLYPLLTREITDTPKMQTYLARRDGDEAVILSPQAFNPEAPLTMKIPVGQTDTLEVKAALGQTGIMESNDSGGAALIADVLPLPEGWVLITQTSVSRMYDSMRVYFGRTVVVTGTVVLYTGLGLALIWRQQLLRLYQAESEAAQKRAAELDTKVRERTAELSELSRQMADMHEKQIHNLARELHDSVGQNLTAINLNLSLLHKTMSAEESDATKARLADTSRLVEETVARMRNVMAEFLPPMLEHYGLTPALEWYGEQFTRRTNMQVHIRDLRAKPERLPPQVEVGLFRIAQEALNNVAKHAGATEAGIELNDDGESILMTIHDNGVGFDPSHALTDPSHWGLLIMRERARVVGGTLEIHSARNAGTTILLRMARQT